MDNLEEKLTEIIADFQIKYNVTFERACKVAIGLLEDDIKDREKSRSYDSYFTTIREEE